MSKASTFYEKTKNGPPRPLLVEAIPYVRHKVSALDLGAGALSDSVYLLEQGFDHVTAVDIEPLAVEQAKALPADRFSYEIASFDEFAFPIGNYDLVNAQYSLPFAAPQAFTRLIERIRLSLAPGGLLVGQFFGDRDSMNVPGKDKVFVSKVELDELLKGFEVIRLQEEEKDKATLKGDNIRHWHVFHAIARVKAQSSK